MKKPTIRGIKTKLGMAKRFLYYKAKKTDLPFYPDRLYIESTNQCNLTCLMCPTGRGDMKRAKGVMTYELFKQVLDEMGPHVRTIVMHIWGEPLLDERIFDKIKYAKKYGVRVEMSTNSTLLDKEKAGKIFDSGLDAIYLCLDGVTKETYESVRRGANYGEVLENIRYFTGEKKRRGLKKPFIHLQIVDMKATHDEIKEFRRKWDVPEIDHINVKALDTWGGQVGEINELEIRDRNLPEKRYHCPNLWYHGHVFWDGTLVSCDRDFDVTVPLGNVKDGFMKAWNGKGMLKLRKKHIRGEFNDIPVCKNCVEWAWWEPEMFSAWGYEPKKKRE